MSSDDPVSVGVVGVGEMGQHHARVYNSLKTARLQGVADADPARADTIAAEYETEVYSAEELFKRVDAVSIAAPTEYHYPLASDAIARETHVLVEKPFVKNLEHGAELVTRAEDNDVKIQVGHIERFNPAITTLSNVADSLSIFSISAERLSSPPNRPISDTVVHDLMIHDLDIVTTLVDAPIADVQAATVEDKPHTAAILLFEDGTMCRFAASRATQDKVRELTVTAESCIVRVDYLDQSVKIYRESLPEYIETDGELRYRHNSAVEEPVVNNGEPLRLELESFLSAIREDTEPIVTAEDGMHAVEISDRIIDEAITSSTVEE